MSSLLQYSYILRLEKMRVTKYFIVNSCVFVVFFLILIYVNDMRNEELAIKRVIFKAKLKELEILCTSYTADNDEVLDFLFEDAMEKFDDDLADRLLILENIMNHLRNKLMINKMVDSGPTQIYEKLRRRIQANFEDFLDVVESTVQPRENETTSVSEINWIISNQLKEARRTILNRIEELADNDDYKQWRRNSSNEARDLVQSRLQHLQNPANCSSAKKLVCALDINCGFGCRFHHIMYCLVMAYATKRTLILHPNNWNVINTTWEEVIRPLSKCHLDELDAQQIVEWKGPWLSEAHKVISIGLIGYISPRPQYLPLAVPIDLKPSLSKFHGNPSAWWMGQIARFLWKPAEATQAMLDYYFKIMGFRTPIVGVHIRRTDKDSEAEFYNVDEYMYHVDKYYQKLEKVRGTTQRRIFLASDEPKVFEEMKRNYPQYEVIKNEEAPKPVELFLRYLNAALNGIILDTHLLSLCDYLVCTLSSNVCRLAYELMQSRHVDASNKLKSLDFDYFFSGQHNQYRKAVITHDPQGEGEIAMEVGDAIDVGVERIIPPGLADGINERTRESGKFPSFKVINRIPWQVFPIYTNLVS